MNETHFAYGARQESNAARYFDINNAGFCRATESDMTSDRPEGRSDFQFIYVRVGEIRFSRDGVAHTLRAPAFLLFQPYAPLLYTFVSDPVGEYYWIHFSGRCAGEILADAGCTAPFGAALLFPDARAVWEEMISLLRDRPAHGKCACNGLFFSALSRMMPQEVAPSDRRQRLLLDRIAPALRQMNNDRSTRRTVEEYARLCYLSKFTFIRHFREATGLPPIAYINEKRMEDALYLLLETDFRMEEIATALGYDDPLYFSRLFRRKYGVSPTDYRKGKRRENG